MSDKAYRVVVTRESDAWLADLPELPGAHTYARTLATLQKAVREVVVLAAELPDDAIGDVRLEWEFHTGDDSLDAETATVRALRAKAEKMATMATEQTASVARKLVDHGESVRDAAVLLGVSAQRISQVTGNSHTGSTATHNRSDRRAKH
jgi:hypothetical protein